MFTHDSLSRLTDSEYGEDGFTKALGYYDERLSYDGNGNITTLIRNGKKQDYTVPRDKSCEPSITQPWTMWTLTWGRIMKTLKTSICL